MSTLQPFTLGFAILNLYELNPDGTIISDPPIFFGACAENLRMDHGLEAKKVHPTGESYPKHYHVGEGHTIVVERIWVINGVLNFAVERNKRYAMEMVFEDPNGTDRYFMRTYYGVMVTGVNHESQGQAEFRTNQTFLAQYFVENGELEAP